MSKSYIFFLGLFIIPLCILTVYQSVINNEVVDPLAVDFHMRSFRSNILPKLKDKILYLIPHSHCDPGWIKTVQEYHEEIVGKIISGVMKELIKDRNKKFIWSEISFFKLWWDEQTPEMHEQIRQLIRNKQLEIVGGGWVMNDEACVEVGDVIDQTTIGHLWIKYNLNTTVRNGWQVDPFGHSSLTPTVFPGFGLETMVINRISQEFKDRMKERKELQFMWEGSRTLDTDSHMFTHALSRHYGYMGDYPERISFEQFVVQIEQVVIRYLWFVSHTVDFYKSKVILLPLGDDFQYLHAERDFKKADFFIQALKDYGIDVRYGTLQDYYDHFIQDSMESNFTYPLYQKDFLPYVSKSTEPWTGYFTTHTVFKSQVREASKLLLATEQLYSLAIAKANSYQDRTNIERLYSLYDDMEYSRRMVGISQHHDSITGTARSYVMHDYLTKLLETKKKSERVYSIAMEYLMQENQDVKVDSGSKYAFQNLLDLDALVGSDQSYSVVFQNSLAWKRHHHTSIRVSLKNPSKLGNIELIDGTTMKPVLVQVIPVVLQNECMKESQSVLGNIHHYNLHFVIQVPPMGITTYFVRVSDTMQPQTHQSTVKIFDDADLFASDKDASILSSRFVTAKFGSDGMLKELDKHVGMGEPNTNVTVKGAIRQYTTTHGGAYLSYPLELVDFISESRLRFISIKGDLVEQLSLYAIGDSVCNPTTVIIHRVYKRPDDDLKPLSTEQTLELGYSVVGDPNRETVVNFQTDLYSHGRFYTDNGMETRVRNTYNSFPTIGYYYYPTIHKTYLKDSRHQFTIYTQRTYGVTSPVDGEMEVMIHRNLLQDDEKGLGYPNADFTRTDGKLYLSVDPISYSKSIQNQLSTIYNTPLIVSTKRITSFDKYQKSYKLQYSLFKNELPHNLHVYGIQFQKLSSDDVKLDKNDRNIGSNLFIRIGHLMANNQDIKLSNPEYLQSNQLFNTDYQLTDLKEKMLNLMDKNEFNARLRLPISKVMSLAENTGDSEYGTHNISNYIKQVVDPANKDHRQMDIHLNPLEIKSYSFKLTYTKNVNTKSLIDSTSVSNGLEIRLENDQVEMYYPQDFSLIPLDTFYNNDIGNHVEYEILIFISFGVSVLFLIFTISLLRSRCQHKNAYASPSNPKKYN